MPTKKYTTIYKDGVRQRSNKQIDKALIDRLLNTLAKYNLKPAHFLEKFKENGRYDALTEPQQIVYDAYPVPNNRFAKYKSEIEAKGYAVISSATMLKIELFLSKYEKAVPLPNLPKLIRKPTPKRKQAQVETVLNLTNKGVQYYYYHLCCTEQKTGFVQLILDAGLRVDYLKTKFSKAKLDGKGAKLSTRWAAIIQKFNEQYPPTETF
jgi:hypothetical protein